jgi:hypothetical protein
LFAGMPGAAGSCDEPAAAAGITDRADASGGAGAGGDPGVGHSWLATGVDAGLTRE